MDRPQVKDFGSTEVFEPIASTNARQRASLIEWLNGILPELSLPVNASDEDLRPFLVDGTVLCRLLNKLKPGSVPEMRDVSDVFSKARRENVEKFLSAMDEMGMPRFQVADLEKGSMKIVVDCLLTLQTHFMLSTGRYDNGNDASSRWKSEGGRSESAGSTPKHESFRVLSSPPFGEDRRRLSFDSRSQRGLRSPRTPASHSGQKFHEVFQLKQGSYTDLPASRISEMMKSNSLDNAPTQSLLSVVNGILDESIEMKNGEIPHRVACLLRKVVQEIERRICTQAEHLRTQSNLFKGREEKYQSRIRVLEALATGTSEETQIVMNQLQQIKSEKDKIDEKKTVEDPDTVKLMKERERLNQEITELKQELERARGSCDGESLKTKVTKDDVVIHEIASLRQELKEKDGLNQEIASLRQQLRERDGLLNQEIANLKKELEVAKKSVGEESLKTKDTNVHDVEILREENDKLKQDIAKLRKELEITRRSSEQDSTKTADTRTRDREGEIEKLKEKDEEIMDLRQEIKEKEKLNQEIVKLRQEVKEKDMLVQEIEKVREELEIARSQDIEKVREELEIARRQEIEKVREELEIARRSGEEERSKAMGTQQELENRVTEATSLLTESRNRVKELEALSESMTERWNKKQQIYHIFTEFQLGALRELRFASQSIQQEVVSTQKGYSEEFSDLGSRIKTLGDAAKNYYPLLAENRKMHNELQELKGNIRVYCRIRPFLPGQKGRQSIIEYVGEDGELVVVNPAKPGKEGRRSFKFDKVYGPTAKQADVYRDTQPLIQSVLDGYNVCIFAYGQTGSGKTYTMSGPDGASEEDWGVNYRALNDLFRISQTRGSIFKYEVSVQMVEIYNEQVRDLLSSDGQKKLGILSTSQPNGLAVPDACIQPVNSPTDVLKLMNLGLQNRAKSSTAMNERSSRSHSILSIHTRGQDLKSGSALRGSLHLVDLAGSERVDRSEVTGDRLKEAQHINKSLSALGDVIFSLAQKSNHVPYRNSKLTQVLQSSLGGRAKTLMFVQLNPDAISFSETISTLKFAERVSGVELGAAKSSKDGRDVRELMEQVASLKDTIAKKDEEIESLQMVKERR